MSLCIEAHGTRACDGACPDEPELGGIMYSFVCCTFPRLLLSVVLIFSVQAALARDGRSEPKLDEVRARAEQGHVQDQIQLGAAYLAGRGVQKDPVQAARWYLKAAQGGSPEAQNQIGYFYQAGIGVNADAHKAAHWFQLASAAGFGWAKVNLGVSYLQGLGVPPNISTARELFVEAANKGTGRAATYLGLMEYFGIGVPVDKNAAQRWFQQGAKLRDPEAAYDLAVLCEGSHGLARDEARAAELLRFAAGTGYVEAKHSLGRLLVNHAELPQKEGEARTELEEASGAGCWKSSVLLGVLWRDGKGGAGRDPQRALYYFDLAGLQGDAEAVKLVAPDVNALKSRLGMDQVSAAGAEAQAWFHDHPQSLVFMVKPGDDDPNFPLMALAEPSVKR